MKARVYFLVFFKADFEKAFYEKIDKQANFFPRTRQINGVIQISSAESSIDYTDLGVSILRYFSMTNPPKLHDAKDHVTAYMQVVPESSEVGELRVYLQTELLFALGQAGYGLDIHSQ